MKLLNHTHVKALVKAGGKRMAAESMDALEFCIREKLQALINTHDGGKKTITPTLVHYVVGKSQKLLS